jgi:hypothetical protein
MVKNVRLKKILTDIMYTRVAKDESATESGSLAV